MQRKLSQWATDDPTKRFVDLYSLLCNEVWLRVAHHSVNTNQGRETAGIDGETMSNFNGDLDGNPERLRNALKAKTFEPMPVRRVHIPKANGKKRVEEKDIRDLLWKFLRAGVMEGKTEKETLTGTPQGGIVIPLLANIYLHELDRYIESKYVSIDRHEKERRRKRGIGNYLYVR